MHQWKETWMKLKVVLAAVLVLLGYVPLANADPVLLINGNGLLIGAHNLKVAGTLYDVMFVDGTCIDVFAGCDAQSDFHFATFEDGIAAANALLGEVFVDAPGVGKFDTHPELTFGCTDPFMCGAAIPTGITGGGVVSGALALNAVVFDVESNFNFLTGFDTGGGTSIRGQIVWAKFTAAEPVPEPASLMLVGSGLAMVRLLRRKRHDGR